LWPPFLTFILCTDTSDFIRRRRKVFSQQEWQQRVEEIVKDRTRYAPYYLLLGMRVKELLPGRSLLELDAGPCHLDERGQVHPGVVFSLADAAAGVAAVTLFPEGSRRVVTVEMKLNYLDEIGAGPLVALGEAEGKRERVILSKVEIFDGGGSKVAFGSATLMFTA